MQTKYCHHCGSRTRVGSKYCSVCGAILDSNAAPTKNKTQLYNPKKVKIEGWLALYAVSIFITIAIFIINLVIAMDINVTDYASEIQDSVQNYKFFLKAFYYGGTVAFLVISYLFFTRSRYTKLAVLVVYSLFLIGAIVEYQLAYDLTSKVNGDLNQVPAGVNLAAFLWPIYWIFSKRVKATFTN